MFGETLLQPEVGGLENDLMETVSHFKLNLSFPLAKKQKKDDWVQEQAPNPWPHCRFIFRKILLTR